MDKIGHWVLLFKIAVCWPASTNLERYLWFGLFYQSEFSKAKKLSNCRTMFFVESFFLAKASTRLWSTGIYDKSRLVFFLQSCNDSRSSNSSMKILPILIYSWWLDASNIILFFAIHTQFFIFYSFWMTLFLFFSWNIF